MDDEAAWGGAGEAPAASTSRLPDASCGADPDGAGEAPGFVADVFSPVCPSRSVLEHISYKWSVLVLAALADGPYRFNALRRKVDGVSEKMLAQTLQVLERDGLIRREVHSAMPPRVEYSLTWLGTEMATPVVALIGLVQDQVKALISAQDQYDTLASARLDPGPSRPPSTS